MKEAEEEITRIKGFVEASVSPWSSNTVLVKQKDGSLRFCVDFRQIPKKDSHPLPKINNPTCTFRVKIFQYIRLSGYWQIGLAENDLQETAFSFPGGELWQFTVLTAGLCNDPVTFERLREEFYIAYHMIYAQSTQTTSEFI